MHQFSILCSNASGLIMAGLEMLDQVDLLAVPMVDYDANTLILNREVEGYLIVD